MQNTQITPRNKHFFIWEYTALCSNFQAEVLAISEVAKYLLLEKNAQSTDYCAGE